VDEAGPDAETGRKRMRYRVRHAETLPGVSDAWEDAGWAEAETLSITSYHPRSTAHRPRVAARLLHDGRTIAGMFRVEDRNVLARATAYQAPTHEDSCVEFFAMPRTSAGYFNFEWNAIGTLRLWYIDRPRRADGSFESYIPVPQETAREIAVHASLSKPIFEEEPGPLLWTVSFRIPRALFETFVGPLGDLRGQTWRANFYKCADASSCPHWGAWSDIGARLDFHQPARFGEIVFE
jgi:hypothetical protein